MWIYMNVIMEKFFFDITSQSYKPHCIMKPVKSRHLVIVNFFGSQTTQSFYVKRKVQRYIELKILTTLNSLKIDLVFKLQKKFTLNFIKQIYITIFYKFLYTNFLRIFKIILILNFSFLFINYFYTRLAIFLIFKTYKQVLENIYVHEHFHIFLHLIINCSIHRSIIISFTYINSNFFKYKLLRLITLKFHISKFLYTLNIILKSRHIINFYDIYNNLNFLYNKLIFFLFFFKISIIASYIFTTDIYTILAIKFLLIKTLNYHMHTFFQPFFNFKSYKKKFNSYNRNFAKLILLFQIIHLDFNFIFYHYYQCTILYYYENKTNYIIFCQSICQTIRKYWLFLSIRSQQMIKTYLFFVFVFIQLCLQSNAYSPIIKFYNLSDTKCSLWKM